MTFFLDTNICSYALKGVFPKIKQHLQQLTPESIKIPSMVRAELLVGAKKSSKSSSVFSVVQKFLSPFEVISFDERSGDVYADIRCDLEERGLVIGPNDLVIAATTMAYQGTLVTHNVKEFKRVKGLKFVDWTR